MSLDENFRLMTPLHLPPHPRDHVPSSLRRSLAALVSAHRCIQGTIGERGSDLVNTALVSPIASPLPRFVPRYRRMD